MVHSMVQVPLLQVPNEGKATLARAFLGKTVGVAGEVAGGATRGIEEGKEGVEEGEGVKGGEGRVSG